MTRVWQEHDLDTIFRRAHRFVDGNEPDAIGAFPVLKFKTDNTFDLIFVRDTAGTIITYSDIHQNDFAMIFLHQRIGESEIIHHGKKFVTAFPIHEFEGSEAAVMLLRPEAVEVKRVPKGAIDIPLPHAINHWGLLVQALVSIDTYVDKNQYEGGFIDCNYYDGYHRLFLFKKEYFFRKPIPEWRLNHLTNFQYNFSNSVHQAPVRRAHNRVCSIIDLNTCNVITEGDKLKLMDRYLNGIMYHNEVPGNPDFLAEAGIHGNYINFAIDHLNTDNHDELTRTVFHEMMHVIGYCHPNDTSDPTYNDSPPVRVENCVPTTTESFGPFKVKCGINILHPGTDPDPCN